MSLFSRVQKNPSICGVEVIFGGAAGGSSISGYQPFFNSLSTGGDLSPIYTGKASVQFKEESSSGREGESYKQTLICRFPSNDSDRSERLEKLKFVRFIKLLLTDGRAIFLGRNDFFQNTRPKLERQSDEKQTTLEFVVQSIFPAGFIPSGPSFQLPAFIPIVLFSY